MTYVLYRSQPWARRRMLDSRRPGATAARAALILSLVIGTAVAATTVASIATVPPAHAFGIGDITRAVKDAAKRVGKDAKNAGKIIGGGIKDAAKRVGKDANNAARIAAPKIKSATRKIGKGAVKLKNGIGVAGGFTSRAITCAVPGIGLIACRSEFKPPNVGGAPNTKPGNGPGGWGRPGAKPSWTGPNQNNPDINRRKANASFKRSRRNEVVRVKRNLTNEIVPIRRRGRRNEVVPIKRRGSNAPNQGITKENLKPRHKNRPGRTVARDKFVQGRSAGVRVRDHRRKRTVVPIRRKTHKRRPIARDKTVWGRPLGVKKRYVGSKLRVKRVIRRHRRDRTSKVRVRDHRRKSLSRSASRKNSSRYSRQRRAIRHHKYTRMTRQYRQRHTTRSSRSRSYPGYHAKRRVFRNYLKNNQRRKFRRWR